MAKWDTFDNRLIIESTLRTVTAIRVGSGGEDAAHPSASDLPVLRGADDRPLIPGSSLRGVIRSQVERIIRTLEPQAGDGRGACIPTEEAQWCIRSEQMNEWREKLRSERDNSNGAVDADEQLATLVWNHTCRVCRVFGSPWLASRVRIADLHLASEAEVLIQRRDGVAIDRDKETVQHKYDFETLPPDTSFQLSITAENLEPAERGLLWLGLRELREGAILLGGFKGRGLGRTTLDDLQIKAVAAEDRTAFRRYLLTGALTSLESDVLEQWVDALLAEVGLEVA
jgi:CRISPR-associated protein Csm3